MEEQARGVSFLNRRYRHLDSAAEPRVLPAVRARVGPDPPEDVVVLNATLVLELNSVRHTLLQPRVVFVEGLEVGVLLVAQDRHQGLHQQMPRHQRVPRRLFELFVGEPSEADGLHELVDLLLGQVVAVGLDVGADSVEQVLLALDGEVAVVQEQHEDVHREEGVVGLAQRRVREVAGGDEQALEDHLLAVEVDGALEPGQRVVARQRLVDKVAAHLLQLLNEVVVGHGQERDYVVLGNCDVALIDELEHEGEHVGGVGEAEVDVGLPALLEVAQQQPREVLRRVGQQQPMHPVLLALALEGEIGVVAALQEVAEAVPEDVGLASLGLDLLLETVQVDVHRLPVIPAVPAARHRRRRHRRRHRHWRRHRR